MAARSWRKGDTNTSPSRGKTLRSAIVDGADEDADVGGGAEGRAGSTRSCPLKTFRRLEREEEPKERERKRKEANK